MPKTSGIRRRIIVDRRSFQFLFHQTNFVFESLLRFVKVFVKIETSKLINKRITENNK